MPFNIIRNDLTNMRVDAIVNATDPEGSGSGGVDLAVHEAAGWAADRLPPIIYREPSLTPEIHMEPGILYEGCAAATEAGKLPCRFVLHTVGPVWQGGRAGEFETLENCYQTCLDLAARLNCSSIAFPLIATGTFGFPKDRALEIALRTIQRFLMTHEMQVWIVVYDRRAYQISEKLFSNIQEYISDRYVEDYATGYPERSERRRPMPESPYPGSEPVEQIWNSRPQYNQERRSVRDRFRQDDGDLREISSAPQMDSELSLEEMLKRSDESFQEMLLRKIDERGMTDSECYKRANVDRRHFSKIRSNRLYKPSKQTAVAFAIALELSLEETNDLLRRAGLAFSPVNTFDIIIEYFIRKRDYDIFTINEVLFMYDQSLLG